MTSLLLFRGLQMCQLVQVMATFRFLIGFDSWLNEVFRNLSLKEYL